MLLNRTCRQNPVLEIKRDAYLAEEKEERDNLIESFKSSINKTKNLHANLLFSTQSGHMMLKDICRLVTYIDPSMVHKDWRDLAVCLGYSGNEVKCINNLKGNVYDPTEIVLQYYAATKDDGTIGHILQALLELKFLAALREAQQHIDALLIEVESEKVDLVETQAGEKGKVNENKISNVLKAADFKPLVPAIFNPVKAKESTVKTQPIYREREDESIQTQSRTPQSKKSSKQYCKYAMLSFASDGYSTALKVAAALRATKNKRGLPIGVLMLCENENQILDNPGQIIPDLMAKMDFIVPILTEGYFKALKEPDLQARLLDERYIQFINDMLVSKYIRDSCLNIQVRSVIPNNAINSVYFREEFIYHTILNAWKSEDEIRSLADSMIKSNKCVITQ